MSKRKYRLVNFKSLDWQAMAMTAGEGPVRFAVDVAKQDISIPKKPSKTLAGAPPLSPCSALAWQP